MICERNLPAAAPHGDARRGMPMAGGGDELPRFTPAELWQVLGRQAALYTGTDSSSLPVETAEELLESVRFCVRIAAAEAGSAMAAAPAGEHTLADWLLCGQRILYRRRQAGLRLQKAAEARCLPLGNPVYREVLGETRHFYRWYDIRFLAHHIPCMIDYPLAAEVDERLRGVDYMNEYLRRRLWEDEFCACFPLAAVEATLQRYRAAWRELPINLYEPVLAAALAGQLLQADTPSLEHAPAALPALRAALAGRNATAQKQQLSRAAGKLCNALHLWGTAARAYHAACAAAMAPRLLAANNEGLAQAFCIRYGA